MTTLLSLLAQTPPAPSLPADDHGTITALYAALTGLLIVLTTVAQTSWQQYQAARLARERQESDAKIAELQKAAADAAALAAKEAADVSKKNSQKLDSVLNGEGISGTLERLAKGQIGQAAWQARHDEKDDQRFGEVHAGMLLIQDLLRQKDIEQRKPGSDPCSPPH